MDHGIHVKQETKIERGKESNELIAKYVYKICAASAKFKRSLDINKGEEI